MSAIINFSIDLQKLPKDKLVKGKKGTYVNLTAFVGDTDQFGNNVGFTISQTKEEREAEDSKRIYVGNGKVAWTDGAIAVAEGEGGATNQVAEVTSDEDDDLPF